MGRHGIYTFMCNLLFSHPLGKGGNGGSKVILRQCFVRVGGRKSESMLVLSVEAGSFCAWEYDTPFVPVGLGGWERVRKIKL